MLRRIITLTCIISMPYTAITQAPAQPQGQQQAPEQMYVPTQEEMEEIINQLSPEEQEALADLGRELIENASDEDLEELSQYLNTTPEELRAEVLGPQETQQQQPDTQKPQPQKPDQTQKNDQKFISTQEVEKLLSDGITVLEKLIQKADALPDNINTLEQHMKPMQDIVAYLKIIRNAQRAPQLASIDYKDIVTTLQTLIPQLQQLEPQIDIPEQTDKQTPYDILGISPDATQETIDQKYKDLKAEKSPEAVEARLQQEGAPPRQIKKAVREARTTFKDIQEAYNTLRDPKMREQLQREQAAQKQQVTQMERTAQEKQNAVISALNTATQNNNLISRLEAFLQSFAPQELEKKKQLEKAEQEQRKAQRERERQRPPQASGQRLEPRPQAPRASREGRPAGGGGQAATQPGQQQSQRDQQQPDRKDKQEPTQQSGGKQAGPAKQQQDTDKKQKKQPGRTGTKQSRQQQQKQQQTLELLRDELAQFSSAYTKQQSTLQSLKQLTQELQTARQISQEQETKLQGLTEQVQALQSNVNVQNIASRLDKVTRTLVAFTQEQYTYWNNNISPYIKQLNELEDVLSTSEQQIQQFTSDIQQNSTVQSAQQTVSELHKSIQPVAQKLHEYNKLISQNRSVIEAFGEKIQKLTQYYTNNSRTIGNIAENIQNLSGKSEAEIDKQAQQYSQYIQNMLDTIAGAEDQPQLDTLNTLLQNGDIPQEQYQTFTQSVGDSRIKQLKNINDTLTSAYNNLTNTSLFSQDEQNRQSMQQLMSQLQNARQKISSLQEVAERTQAEINKALQQTSQAPTTATTSQQQETSEESTEEANGETNGATEGNAS